tara:strand:- start:626 stop:853 length:228 start_codon:yes stop_codon:yes gene_type:complete
MTYVPEKVWIDYSPHTEDYGAVEHSETYGYTAYTCTDLMHKALVAIIVEAGKSNGTKERVLELARAALKKDKENE